MRRTVLLLVLTCCAPSPGWSATPEEVAKARRLAREGAVSFRDKRFDDALAAFREANRLVPHPNLDVNIGRTYEALGQPDQEVALPQGPVHQGEEVPVDILVVVGVTG